MNKLIKMATVVAGVGAMLGIAGCGEKASPIEEFTSSAREVNALWKSVTGESDFHFYELGARLSELGDMAKVSKVPADKFKVGYDALMPTFKNAKVYFPMAIKAKEMSEVLRRKYKYPTYMIEEQGFDEREVARFLDLDVDKQLKAIDKMKATITKLDEQRKLAQKLMENK